MALLLLLTLLSACGPEPATDVVSLPVPPGEACTLDGMLIGQHDGPKAQLLRHDGERAYFCDAAEVFGEWLDPVRQRRVAGLWFQGLDEGPWEAHDDGWSQAQDLFFVAGSRRLGAMGPTLAPFMKQASARAFVEQYGGTIYRFDDIDAAVIQRLRRQRFDHLTRN
ncbi:MAG: nitrous oxide reductase accessory protein NosL [Candidatus Latescibacteria bacterium]|nr:nitrous oxide reductase accessory protein NosL [Candidatus Latescibacterota bacterium]MDP7449301.1 nitrous oxide reductase accessory protein NosL [Candidatus Latescibacterota bacterium]HJP30545.1 nitrous oxide reductase accessory protein NosL [Candidatus Latescibacterota bacterium]